MNRLPVTVPADSSSRTYDVLIEDGLLRRVGDVLDAVLPSAGRILLAVDQRIADDHGAAVHERIAATGRTCVEARLDASESAKTLETVRAMYETMLAAGLTRADAVVALGGGIIGDTAGYAASTYLRGVDLVQVPTTLLAMVDASIGGKTGVNLPLPGGGLGKNLVGSFWPPAAVVIDPTVLSTLSPRDFRCGLAECVKHGMIASGILLESLEAFADRLAADRAIDADETLTDLITRSAQVKIDIVVNDVRERGRRALLNLGHSFAHAFESVAELGLRHGEAVAIGLCSACDVAVATDRMSGAQRDRVQTLLERLGLPITLPQAVPVDTLLAAMVYDKKNVGGVRRLILPVGLGSAEIVEEIPDATVADALRAVGAR